MRYRVNSALLSILFLLYSITLSVGDAVAAVHHVDLPLAESWRADTPDGRLLASVAADPDADRPAAPVLTWWWLVGDGERIADATFERVEERQLGGLRRTPETATPLSSEGRAAELPAGRPLYGDRYTIRISAPKILHGQVVQAITVAPLRAEAHRLFGLTDATVRLAMTDGAPTPARCAPLHPDFPLRERLLDGLGDRILNPEALPPAGAGRGPFGRAVGGDAFPTGVPNIEGSLVEMVVVTVDSFADLCGDFILGKTRMGVPTTVRTVEWIAAHYPQGSDRPEMIRNFTRDAYEKWGIKYVLLLGDSDQIPPRYVYTEIFSPYALSPTDLYFGCLDGDWNADHDNLWGEALNSSGQGDDDEADFLPEVIVGRLPAANREECATLLRKSKRYQNCDVASYHDRLLMLGEVLFPADWTYGDEIIYDGAEFCDSVIDVGTNAGHALTALYENHYDYPYSEVLTRQSALDSMAAGYGVVLHNGHGARQTMSVGDGSLDVPMVSSLDNGYRTFLLYMVNCTAAAFDFTCIAETFLKNPDGGASMVIGSTRETFPTFSSEYMYLFFNTLNDDPSLRLGEAYTAGLNTLEPQTEIEGGYRWAHSTFTLLGDPSSWLHYARLETLQVDHPAIVNPLTETCDIAVTDSEGLPVADVLVSIYKGSEDLQYAVTDDLGQVSFTLKAETGGFYRIRTSKRDTQPFDALFSADPDGQPLLALQDVGVAETEAGGGPGLGVLDRGETVALYCGLSNDGDIAAHNVTAVLISAHPAVTILDGAASFGDVPADGYAACLDSFRLTLGDVADDEIIPFEVVLTTDEGTFEENFFIEAAAPLLGLHRVVIDDSQSGNGDGLLDIDEFAVLPVRLTNEGRGTGFGVTATLAAPAGSGLVVYEATAAVGDISALTADVGPFDFVIKRVGPEDLTLELRLVDAYGHADTLAFELEYPPDMTTGPEFIHQVQPQRMLLEWQPPATGEVAGYVVHRAEAPEGPYVEVSSHIVPHCAFEDDGLAAYTSYWYRVQALSSGALTGAWSDSASVTTNLAAKAGWPVRLGQETPSSPVVADVDGDGTLEVIIGSDRLCGFHLDGSELGDGDGDPETRGPVTALGQRYFCSLSATDLTDSPGLEIVAGSWDTGEVYVFEFDATPDGIVAAPAPGWPQTIGYESGHGIWGTPSLGDFDGDGDMEIFVADVGGYLNAWHHDGTEVRDGDGIPFTQGIFTSGVGTWIRSTVSFGDTNGDGAMEPFLASTTGAVHAWRQDGHHVLGFPFQTPWQNTSNRGIFSSPVIGDVDGDEQIEIVFACENDSLYMVNHDGALAEGWPIRWDNDNASQMCPTPALADFDGDGFPEIVACANFSAERMDIAVIDADASFLPGWPQTLHGYSQASPVVADIDGDGELEIVIGDEVGALNAWNHDGTPVGGFPMVTGDWMRATPTIMDMDDDGLVDLLAVGWNKTAYLWETGTPFDPDGLPWYTFMHDQKRSGNAGTLDWVVGVGDEHPGIPGIVRLDANWPNPFNPVTNIRFTVGGDEPREVALSIFDAGGRRVRRLLTDTLEPGVYQLSWEGRDDHGRALASSIYFARLRVGDVVETRKMTLLK